MQLKTESYIEFKCGEHGNFVLARVTDGRLRFSHAEWPDEAMMAIAAEDIPAFLTALGDLLRG